MKRALLRGSAKRSSRLLALLIGVLALAAYPVLSDNLYVQNMLILTFILAIGASGWNIMGGYAGYISLGSSLFTGLGAYTAGILVADFGVPPFIGCLVGGVTAGVAAALLSLVTRRTRGMYFVIVTFAALQLFGLIARNWKSVTGGSSGLAMPLPMWNIAYQDWPFYYSLLVVLLAAIAVSVLIRRSKLGTGLFAIKDDEDKASGIGINAAAYKMIAFVLGSIFIGVAGGIYAYYISFITPAGMFDIVASVLMVLAALLGGRGTIWGPVLGAFIIEPLSELTTTSFGGPNAGSFRLLFFAGILVLVVLFLPKGLIPSISEALHNTARMGALRIARGSSSSGASARTQVAGERGASAMAGDALKVSGLTKSFGGVKAVNDVSLRVGAGSVTGLIGPNGSGKTTLFNLIDGTVTPKAGTVALAGTSIERASRARRAHAGLARTYQLPRLFDSLSVIENVVAPERRFSLTRLFLPRMSGDERDQALDVLAQFGLAGFADISPSDLSYGQRKLVELAQILSLDPVLVMLDEPAAGISPALTERLTAIIRNLNGQGIAILLVEHDLAFIAELCDNVFVMADGEVVAEGTVAELTGNAVVVDAYLGEPAALGIGKVKS
ncbi:MAG: transporter [Subtercola sp.]|nr:transporter [Subtercola sp.]